MSWKWRQKMLGSLGKLHGNVMFDYFMGWAAFSFLQK